jgi:hypothetical protein
MRVSKSTLAAGFALSALSLGASAAVITSTVTQSGFGARFSPVTGLPILGLQSGGSYPITDNPDTAAVEGYTFAPGQITSVDRITVTITMDDGDSSGNGEPTPPPDDFDFNNLTLRLDDIDTGLVLNGFPNNAIFTADLTQVSPATSAALIAALADGVLVGSVFDSDSDGVTATNPDFIGFPDNVDTTLVLEGQAPGGVIPLPMAALMGPLGAGLVGYYSRRFRNRK